MSSGEQGEAARTLSLPLRQGHAALAADHKPQKQKHKQLRAPEHERQHTHRRVARGTYVMLAVGENTWLPYTRGMAFPEQAPLA
jgi:hypothetical protein